MNDFQHLKHSLARTGKVSKYSFGSIFFRIIISSIVALFTIQYVRYSQSGIPFFETPAFIDYAIGIGSFILISETLVILDIIIEHIIPFPRKFKLRFFVQLVISLIIAILIIGFALKISPKQRLEGVEQSVYYIGMALGSVFVVFITSSLIILRILQNWIIVHETMDKMKEEKMKQDYNALQDQLNPHFLFNNLSVLKSMIIYNKEAAVEFTEKFTDVYRYVLQSKDKILVKFKDELLFIEAFIGIHKDRLGTGLDVSISIDKEFLQFEIAPLSLQLLVENAIKHNIASIEKPLKLSIATDGALVRVENNIQLKESSYSTNTGLNNLLKRYSFLTDKEISIEKTEERFIVEIPLLKSK